MKRFLLLFTLVFSNAKSQELFLKYDNVTWEELKVLQKDYLQSAEDLSLDLNCPDSVEDLKKAYHLYYSRSNTILGTYYSWDKYLNPDNKFCVVRKISNLVYSTSTETSEHILSVNDARILLSASNDFRFTERGLNNELYKQKALEIYKHNNKIATELSKKYGGINRMWKFVREKRPETWKTDFPNYYKNISAQDYYSFRFIPDDATILDWFENYFSQEQKQELIDRVANPGFTESNLELLNKTWKLKSYQFYEQELIPVPENRKYHFYLDGASLDLRGTVDCNSTRGSFSLEGYQLKLQLGISTLMGCITSKEQANQWINHLNKVKVGSQMNTAIKPTLNKSAPETTEKIENKKDPSLNSEFDIIEVSQLLGKVITYQINNGELTLITDTADMLIFSQ